MRAQRRIWWGAALASGYLATYVYLRATCRGEACLGVGVLAGPMLGIIEGRLPAKLAEPVLIALNLAALFAIGWASSALWYWIRRGDAR